ncbi:MAG: hypothetical protein ACFB20_12755 [Opitutales bacterium]
MSLDARIEHIRKAKRQADQIAETLSPGHNAAEAVIGILWEAIFDHLCAATQTDYDVDALGKLSSAIQRMVSSNAAFKALEHKIADQQVKVEERTEAKEAVRKSLEQSTSTSPGLSPDTIAEIEARLALL